MKPELILPGGDLNRAKLAFEYGADAVYCGLNKHSLRKAEIRFDIPEIKEAIEYAHAIGKRLFVTFNIFAHNKQLKDIEKDMTEIAKFKPDAFIMADLGVINIAKRVAPNVPINVSTQANTVNIEDVKFWASQGVKRVVLARELTLGEINEIHKAVPDVELEVFVHGAMCISYSGRCLMSNYMTGRNANLGECAQPCRWNYKVYQQSVIPTEAEESLQQIKGSLDYARDDNEKLIAASTPSPRNDTRFFLEEQLRPGELFKVEESERGTAIMSSKDLRLVRYLPEILDAGVVGLKIEGRNKSEYYVATAAHTYREALNLIEVGKYTEKDKERLEKELEKLNYRGYTTGFIFGDAKAGETYPDRSPIRKWDYVGKVIPASVIPTARPNDLQVGQEAEGSLDKLRDDNLLFVSVNNKIVIGDEIEVLTPNSVFTEKVMEIKDENGNEVSEINPGKTDQKAYLKLSKVYPANSFLRKELKIKEEV